MGVNNISNGHCGDNTSTSNTFFINNSEDYNINSSGGNITTTGNIYLTINCEYANQLVSNYYAGHEVVKKILSQIYELATSGRYILKYNYSDDIKNGKWSDNIVKYLEDDLGYRVWNDWEDNELMIKWE